jgi:hypothetical protein
MSGVQIGPGATALARISFSRQQLREAGREVLDSSLGGRIGEQAGIGTVGIDRRGVDDRAARLHVGHRGLGEVEHGVDVDAEGKLPLLVADVADIGEGCLVGGIVDEDVDTTEFADRRVYDLPAVLGRLDVARCENSLAARFLDPLLRFLRVLILVEIGNKHIRAFASIGDRHGPADSAVGAGDDRLLAGKSA